MGNELIDRETPDGATNIQFVDLSLPFPSSGRLTAWDWYAGRAGEMSLQIWRPCESSATCYALVCENTVTAEAGAGHLDVPPADRCIANAQDVIGERRIPSQWHRGILAVPRRTSAHTRC